MGAIIKSPRVLEHHALASPFTTPMLRVPEAPSLAEAEAVTTSEILPIAASSATSSSGETQGLPLPTKESAPKIEPKDVEHLEQLREQARQDGFKRGYAEGKDLVNEECAELLLTLRGLVQTGTESLNQVLGSNHGLMASIVFEAVCKIIGDRLVTIEGCKELLTHAIRDIHMDELIAIKVSPLDLSRIEQADSTVSEAFAGLPMEADATIDLGGCVVQLRDGAIDARLETQMSMFAEGLREIARHDEI